jgi:hypothetical protein
MSTIINTPRSSTEQFLLNIEETRGLRECSFKTKLFSLTDNKYIHTELVSSNKIVINENTIYRLKFEFYDETVITLIYNGTPFLVDETTQFCFLIC